MIGFICLCVISVTLCVAMIVMGVWMFRTADGDGIGLAFGSVFTIVGVALLVGFSSWAYSEATEDHPSVTLRLDTWECTATRRETYTSMTMVGKVMVPQTHTRTVCDNYARIAS